LKKRKSKGNKVTDTKRKNPLREGTEASKSYAVVPKTVGIPPMGGGEIGEKETI